MLNHYPKILLAGMINCILMLSMHPWPNNYLLVMVVGFFFRRKQLENLPHCSCVMIYDIQIKNNIELANAHWPGRLQELEYGFAIQKFSSPEKCFTYMVHHQIDNLRATSREINNLLSKDISSMNEDELTQVIMLLKGKDF